MSTPTFDKRTRTCLPRVALCSATPRISICRLSSRRKTVMFSPARTKRGPEAVGLSFRSFFDAGVRSDAELVIRDNMWPLGMIAIGYRYPVLMQNRVPTIRGYLVAKGRRRSRNIGTDGGDWGSAHRYDSSHHSERILHGTCPMIVTWWHIFTESSR